MPRKSTVTALLPPAELRDLNEMIGSGRYTLDGLVEWLAERGYTLSRSALHRHGVDVRKVAEKLQQSREVTQALVAELGDAAAQGKQGRLLVEMARSIVFDLLMKLQTAEGDAPALTPMDVAMLGKGLAELGRALRFDQDFETKIREQVEKETRAEAAKKLDGAIKEAAVAGEKGLSAERAAQLRRDILGMSG